MQVMRSRLLPLDGGNTGLSMTSVCAVGVRVSGWHQIPEAGRLWPGDGGGGAAVHCVRNAHLRGTRDHRRDGVRNAV